MIRRKITNVEVAADGGLTQVTMECGHTAELVQHFVYKIGGDRPCFACNHPAKAPAERWADLVNARRVKQGRKPIAREVER